MEIKPEKTKNTKRKTVPAVKCKDDIQEYLEAMDHFTDSELKIMIFGRVAPKLEKPAIVQLAVRQYLITKESYFLDKAMEGIENIISNRRYETGIHEEICQGIKTLYAEDSVTEELTEWLTKLTQKVLQYAVICNMKVFFYTIAEISQKHNVAITAMHKMMIEIYGSNGKERLMIEFRRCKPEHEWQVPGCCLQEYYYTESEDADYDFGEYIWEDADSLDDEVESEDEDDSEDIDDMDDYDDEYEDENDYDDYDFYEYRCCDPAVCKIYSKILYFTTSICLYKSWVDSSWNDCSGADLGIETHRKYCGYIKQAYALLEGTYCENPDIDMDLLQAQYQLFVNTYVNM